MNKRFLVITSIADDKHPVLNKIAKDSKKYNTPFIVIGDEKSPEDFEIEGCDFYSVKRQKQLNFRLVENLPYRHYARKNLGYLIAMSQGADVIMETDDDNIPLDEFWKEYKDEVNGTIIKDKGWVNVYEYFSDKNIWPRGFSLEDLKNKIPDAQEKGKYHCPIQQGLADDNPDVDAIYRLIGDLPVRFSIKDPIILTDGAICPFNSQNTIWFKEAFPLLYLPSYCSFRMTDIWRSFVAQRIAWTCDWGISFHSATVKQERNNHNLLRDFEDEIVGYVNNKEIMDELNNLNLKKGEENIFENMKICYEKLIRMGLVGSGEIGLLNNWKKDIISLH
jgi:hypothetical protein